MAENSTDALDLYAKAEDLLGVKEATADLYSCYFRTLRQIDSGSLLDVGCGSGDFLVSLRSAFPGMDCTGIDLSPVMVESAKKRGVVAKNIDLCEMEGCFDTVTSVFDVLNYLSPADMDLFFKCVRQRLHTGGYFLCDINTLYGFEHVAVGCYTAEESDRFVSIESEFDNGIYRADFTLFEKSQGGLYRRYSQTLYQYYHPFETVVEVSGLTPVDRLPITLYSEEPDKEYIVLKKEH